MKLLCLYVPDRLERINIGNAGLELPLESLAQWDDCPGKYGLHHATSAVFHIQISKRGK